MPIGYQRRAFPWFEAAVAKKSEAAASTHATCWQAAPPPACIATDAAAYPIALSPIHSPSVQETIVMVQHIATGHVDADAPLMDAGLDSIGAVELRNLLQGAAGGETMLPDTLIFDYPTPRRLAIFLKSRNAVGSRVSVLPKLPCAADAAMCGSSACLPGGVDSSTTQRLLACGADGVREVPLERWSIEALPAMPDPIASRARHGGFVNGAELFDSMRFGVSQAEAAAMDPQQRAVLEHGYSALHAAGLSMPILEESATGVFIGIQALEFPELLATTPAGSSVYSSTGCAHAIACGRVSFALAMQGPCASYDTACSAGLVATHAASSALTLEECAAGLAVGINLMLLPAASVGCAVAGMTSALGRCHTFDRRADGYARSEACCASVLRQRHVDMGGAAYTLCGSAVRQDGRSASLTAPSGQAQRALRLAARTRAASATRPSGCAEAHGTGTALGDPIEAGSYAAVARALGDAFDALVSVKANVGHSEPAAGTSGLLSLTLHLAHSRASPNGQLRALNQRVGAALGELESALHVQPAPLPTRVAGGNVSSFGYGGTIAHALVEREAHDASRLSGAMLPERLGRRQHYQWQPAVHPFAQQCVASEQHSCVVRSPAAGAMLTLIADHVVQGQVVFPGTGYLELARAACHTASRTEVAGLCAVFVIQPLLMHAARSVNAWVECVVGSDNQFKIASGPLEAAAMQDESVHCKGECTAPAVSSLLNICRYRVQCPNAAEVQPMYAAFERVGLQYGPDFRRLALVWVSTKREEALAALVPRSAMWGTRVHPADLDCIQHLELLLASTQAGNGPRLPFSYDEATLRLARRGLRSVRQQMLASR